MNSFLFPSNIQQLGIDLHLVHDIGTTYPRNPRVKLSSSGENIGSENWAMPPVVICAAARLWGDQDSRGRCAVSRTARGKE